MARITVTTVYDVPDDLARTEYHALEQSLAQQKGPTEIRLRHGENELATPRVYSVQVHRKEWES